MESVFIILNYNDSKTTIKLVNSIKDYKILDKIVIVDNCSKDDSYIELSSLINDKIDVLTTEENGGYAKGNNYGIRYAIKKYKPNYIFVGNPDIAVSEMVLDRIMKILSQDPKYGIASAIVEQGYNIWRLPGFWGIIESLFLIVFNIDKYLIKKNLIKRENYAEVGVIEGSFFCITKNAYEKVEGFDERTFLYCEENILCKRLRTCGFKSIVLTNERYQHLHSQSIKKEYKSKSKAFENFYHSFKLYNKVYLKTNILQDLIFEICYKLGYIERLIFDLIKNRILNNNERLK